ncbi:Fe-only nitrogenase accessory protein AnfO [Pararhodospirillum photometricum]|uniref:Fe-only nitrogenase accessory protein AnfO n=1 Tax=Pararhodospirillum photometricum TaxID=1084 RepID=UPI0002EBD84F|nr:Fe-only nitrogenase accessory protein AnfO [Pararhodospirillum photometricum]
MKIAVCVDRDGEPAALFKGQAVRLYQQSGDTWVLRREILLDLRADEGLAALKLALHTVWSRLEDCREVLLREVRGIGCVILQDDMGVRLWRSEGALAEQLDNVGRKIQETPRVEASGCGCGGRGRAPEASGQPDPAPDPEVVAPGHLRVDLAALLAADTRRNSRDLLAPLLEARAFERLDIVCEHLPRWFDSTLARLDLQADVQPEGAFLCARVVPVPAAAQGGCSRS